MNEQHTPVQDRTPEQYRETIERFVIEYYRSRRWELEQAFIGLQIAHIDMRLIQNSALADTLCDIARAAAGKMQHSDDGWNEGVLHEGIQDLMERLFAAPGLSAAYDIPDRFWDTDLGQMVARALLWIRRDELITQAEAAEIRGVTIQAINQAISAGRLRGYHDPDAPQRHGRVLVSRADVETMD